jgi:hypothetical protein
MITLYKNTFENAKRIGWIGMEEYWVGDPNSDFVIHDTQRGLFYFVNAN